MSQRIVSLVPSQTELLFDLGVTDELVGLTKFCIHPADKVRAKAVVGGTKTVHIERVLSLQPTLIIANKEENTREQVEALQHYCPVHVTDVTTLTDALTMIREVGNVVNRNQQADTLAQQIKQQLTAQPPLPAAHSLSVAYLIWRKPYMVAASQTFIHSMLGVAGFTNAFAHLVRYPELRAHALQTANPDLIFLSSEPYPFQTKHIAELQMICPRARLLLVDGELFSWYGSRLLQAGAYFNNLHTEITRLIATQ